MRQECYLRVSSRALILVISFRVVISCSTVDLRVAISSSANLCHPMQHCYLHHLKLNYKIMQQLQTYIATPKTVPTSVIPCSTVILVISSRIVISCSTVDFATVQYLKHCQTLSSHQPCYLSHLKHNYNIMQHCRLAVHSYLKQCQPPSSHAALLSQ